MRRTGGRGGGGGDGGGYRTKNGEKRLLRSQANRRLVLLATSKQSFAVFINYTL